jgi:hypothetical protein
MSDADVPLFTSAGLEVLNRRPYDPAARASYDILSGGLIWPDEFPRIGSPEWLVIAPRCAYRYLIAYRASLTLGEELPDFRPVWDQVTSSASNWPGLRAERRGETARRRLLAAKQRETRCLDALESELGRPNPQ